MRRRRLIAHVVDRPTVFTVPPPARPTEPRCAHPGQHGSLHATPLEALRDAQDPESTPARSPRPCDSARRLRGSGGAPAEQRTHITAAIERRSGASARVSDGGSQRPATRSPRPHRPGGGRAASRPWLVDSRQDEVAIRMLTREVAQLMKPLSETLGVGKPHREMTQGEQRRNDTGAVGIEIA